MNSELCAEDVVVRLTAPQDISSSGSEGLVSSAGGGGSGGGGRAGAGGAELGRRLLLAARAGDTPLVLDLMAKGAPFTTDWLGTSPLHLAAGHAHTLTCAVLLRAGVSRDARSKVERTPLHLAAAAGHAAVAALLLEQGARVDPRDMLRMTPLHWAVERRHAAVVSELLRHGADPELRCKFRRSPRDMARAHPQLHALIEDHLRQRAAAQPGEVNQQQTETLPLYETVERLTDSTPAKPKTQERPAAVKLEQKTEEAGAGAALLRTHGITLLPPDPGSTVLSALQSGRTIVLSDAGKLMLKESSGASRAPGVVLKESKVPGVVLKDSGTSRTPSAAGKESGAGKTGVVVKESGAGKTGVVVKESGAGKTGVVVKESGAGKTGGVVLTATPVRAARPGVKVFTLHNNLLQPAPPAPPASRLLGPQDMQVKVVEPVRAGVRGRARPAVKIIMNKANFNRLLANANWAHMPNAGPQVTSAVEEAAGVREVRGVAEAEEAVEAGGAVEAGESEASLRAQLGAARRALAALSAELQACRARLAAYEQP